MNIVNEIIIQSKSDRMADLVKQSVEIEMILEGLGQANTTKLWNKMAKEDGDEPWQDDVQINADVLEYIRIGLVDRQRNLFNNIGSCIVELARYGKYVDLPENLKYPTTKEENSKAFMEFLKGE